MFFVSFMSVQRSTDYDGSDIEKSCGHCVIIVDKETNTKMSKFPAAVWLFFMSSETRFLFYC